MLINMKTNGQTSSTESLAALIGTDNFGSMSEENQKAAISSIDNANNTEKEGGWMGRFFGTKKENAAMNVAFSICALLILLCAIDAIHAMYVGANAYTELIKNVLPIISLAIGFIFGKSEK